MTADTSPIERIYSALDIAKANDCAQVTVNRLDLAKTAIMVWCIQETRRVGVSLSIMQESLLEQLERKG